MPYPGLFSRRKLSGPSITCCTARSHSARLDVSRRVDHGRPVCDCARVGRAISKCRYPMSGRPLRSMASRRNTGSRVRSKRGSFSGVSIKQDSLTARADEAVLWIDRAPPASQEESRVTVYLEGSVAVDFGRSGQAHANSGTAAQSIRDHSWFGRLTTRSGVDVRAPVRTDVRGVKPAVYQRGEQAWDQAASGVRQAQFTTQPAPVLPPPGLPPPALQPPPAGFPPSGMQPPAMSQPPPGFPPPGQPPGMMRAATCRAITGAARVARVPAFDAPRADIAAAHVFGARRDLAPGSLGARDRLGKTRAGWPAEQRPDSHQEFSRHASQPVGDGLQ